MNIFKLVLSFIIGLCVGSFLDVLIDRLPKGQDVVKARSHCDFCKKTLAWYDMVPLISYILLSGRCRYCRKKFSLEYPGVELITGIIFAATYLYSPAFNVISLARYIIFSGLLVIFITDLKQRIIPDAVLVPLIFTVIITYAVTNIAALPVSLLTGTVLCGFFLLLFLITSGRGMGFGDVKYAFFMGLFLGFPNSVVAFYLAFLTGAAVSLILILRGKKNLKGTIPFGPFLVLATFISYIFGGPLWRLFIRLAGLT